MKEGRDLAVTLLTSAMLLLAVSYLTQCSAPSQRSSPTSHVEAQGGAAPPDSTAAGQGAASKPKGGPRSVHELEEESEEEERAKIQRVGHALQTIGANPELSKTLGIPQ